jgi:hypothetical protein
MTENKENSKMDRKKFLGSLALMGTGMFFFRNLFSYFSGTKEETKKAKITVKENPYSVKRNSKGGVNGRA